MIILIIFVVIVVFVSCIYFNTSKFDKPQIIKLEDKLYNGDKLNGYRLADVIFYPDYLTNKHQYSTSDHLYRFPDTIGTIYVKRKYPELSGINSPEDFEKQKDNYTRFEKKVLENLHDIKIDIELLNDIIKQKQFSQPNFPYSTLMLHVRVGDVLCNYKDMDHA
jgi:hypothetical protein